MAFHSDANLRTRSKYLRKYIIPWTSQNWIHEIGSSFLIFVESMFKPLSRMFRVQFIKWWNMGLRSLLEWNPRPVISKLWPNRKQYPKSRASAIASMSSQIFILETIRDKLIVLNSIIYSSAFDDYPIEGFICIRNWSLLEGLTTDEGK